MKKNKKLTTLTIVFIIVLIIILSVVFEKKDAKLGYTNYLSNKYGKEFIVLDKIDSPKSINNNYTEAYNCILKDNSDIKFIVGRGRFKAEKWSAFKSNLTFDTYSDVVNEYLRDKYKKTIYIDNDSMVSAATVEIQNIVKLYKNEYVDYGLRYGNAPAYFTLYFNIQYEGRIIENVIIYNENNIHDCIVDAIGE